VNADRSISALVGPPAEGIIGPTGHDTDGARPSDNRLVHFGHQLAIDLDFDEHGLYSRPPAKLINAQDMHAVDFRLEGTRVMSLDPRTWSIGREYPAGVAMECPSVI
jgi:hypothetical protein